MKSEVLGMIGIAVCGVALQAGARELHVSTGGDDAHDGSATRPLRTIQEAANRAQPGDTITVHAGVYRERVNPPRGGESDDKRITYQAAPGADVVIKGSEPAKGWTQVQHDTWMLRVPNALFGDFNPFRDVVSGDWCHNDRGYHTGAVYLNGHWLTETRSKDDVLKPAGAEPLWYTHNPYADGATPVTDENADTTVIWAQFPGVDPNEADVEINVRQSVFYPDEPGRNYITVRGFTMEHAATPWAPPTAEQIGVIGTHWSRGWIIEDNTIRYSVCVGITLGKYGDEFDNRAGTAKGYVGTIERALTFDIPWTRDHIGNHMVRNNHISHCEQAGIVGSLGAAFSTITGNVIHDIFIRQQVTGYEMAGIKLHAPIDTIISRNHIYRSGFFGIWLDWMTQGTHVTGNLLHNHGRPDIFVEVNHGPFLIENNVLLSENSLRDFSQGGAYAHNLFAGGIHFRSEENRATPYHKAHATEIAGLLNIAGGDSRFYNNIFIAPARLTVYDGAARQMWMEGNLFLGGAVPSRREEDAVVKDYDPELRLTQDEEGAWWLALTLEKAWAGENERAIVTSERLGRAEVPNLPFVQPDGSPFRLDRDFFGNQRNAKNPFPGPFEIETGGRQRWAVGVR